MIFLRLIPSKKSPKTGVEAPAAIDFEEKVLYNGLYI